MCAHMLRFFGGFVFVLLVVLHTELAGVHKLNFALPESPKECITKSTLGTRLHALLGR